MHKLGKRKASEVDFWRFLMICGVPREAQKCTKMEKMPSEIRSKKRRQKRRRPRQSGARVGGHRAARRNARFLLRKVFAMISETNLQTPPLPAECGGLSSHTRRPPHSTKVLALVYVKKVGQNLGGFCQDLDRTLAVSGRILLHKKQLRS